MKTIGIAELYDELNDHEETHDVAGEPANSKRIADLQEKLKHIGPFTPGKTDEPGKKASKRADAGEMQILNAGAELSDEDDMIEDLLGLPPRFPNRKGFHL